MTNAETFRPPMHLNGDPADRYLGVAYNFHLQGIQELNGAITGEYPAKRAVLAGVATGQNIALIGHPGTGKTELMEGVPQLISDLRPDGVVWVPSQADLLPQRLVGGKASVTKEIKSGGKQTIETTTSEILAIVKPDTQFMIWDEASRMNPGAMNELLKAFENRALVTDTGIVPLRELIGVISALNPDERRQATFAIPCAVASRHATGAIMGEENLGSTYYTNASGERHVGHPGIIRSAFLGIEKEPVKPIITADALRMLSKFANKSVVVPEPVMHAVEGEIIPTAVTHLGDRGLAEGAGRIAAQSGRTARMLALFEGRMIVNEADVREAATMALVARVGMLQGISAAKEASQVLR
ncbi:MAG: AAA family ATPase [Candidatus Saccharimonadales bacterium]